MLSIISYMLVTTSCCFASLIKEFNKGKNKLILGLFLLAIISIFLCSGYMTGSDWPQYEDCFYERGFFIKEQGLSWIYNIAKHLNFEFWPTSIILKLFCFACFTYLLTNICNNFWLTLALLLPKICFFLFIDNPMRNLIAMSFFWLSCIAYIKNKKLLEIIFIICAILFHFSTVCILLSLCLFYFKKFIIKHNKITLLLIGVAYCVLGSHSILMSTFETLLKLLGISRGLAYFTDNGNEYSKYTLFSPTMLLSILSFLLIYTKRKYFIISEIKSRLFIVCIIHLLLSRLGYSILILGRLSMFTEPIFVAMLINSLESINNIKIRCFLKFFTIAFSLLFTINTITKDYYSDRSRNVYLPYSNYFIEETLLNRSIPFCERLQNNSKQKYSSINDVL